MKKNQKNKQYVLVHILYLPIRIELKRTKTTK